MSLEGTIVETPLHRLASHAWKAIAGVGAVSIIVGLIALIWPGPTTVVIGVLFGIFLLLSGLMGLFVGLAVPMPGFVRAASLLVSALSVVLGLLCFRSETHSVTLLGLWIGIGWIMNSMTMLARGLSTKGQGRGWVIVFPGRPGAWRVARRDRGDVDAGDAVAVGGGDGEAVVEGVDGVAVGGDVAQFVHHEPAQRVVGPVGQSNPGLCLDVVVVE